MVGIAIVGHTPSTSSPAVARAASAASAAATPAPAPLVAAATPSPRSDWPAAINRTQAGRIPRVNRFTIDDSVLTARAWDSTPPWVRTSHG